MKLPRRNFLNLAAGAAALPAVSRLARAQDYPARPVRLIVGFAPGGTTDITARLIGQWLSERLGQQFVIENRTGAATNIATEAVVRAPADGYTLLLVTASNAINATLYDKLPFNFIRDIAPVAGHYPLPPCHAGESIVPGEDRSRVHQLCEVQSRQDQLRIGRHRHIDPCRQRTVQNGPGST
jgi:tripartite-type tricarboxylate transporter receptor subunit TctC